MGFLRARKCKIYQHFGEKQDHSSKGVRRQKREAILLRLRKRLQARTDPRGHGSVLKKDSK